MDKIYSRRKLTLPIITFKKNQNRKKYLTICVVLIIALVVMSIVIKGINPIIDKICTDESKSKATLITNQETTKIMANYTYSDIITIYKDSSDNITMIESNIIVINEITSSIANNIQETLNEETSSTVYIKFGSFTGMKILSGLGPSIPIRLSSSGNVETKVKSEFEEAGINQTIHRIYLEVVCNVNILTPYNVIEDTINNEVVLIENVIVGLVPSTYYNLEGMEERKCLRYNRISVGSPTLIKLVYKVSFR